MFPPARTIRCSHPLITLAGVLLVAVIAAVIWPIAPASAHDQLLDSSPEADENLGRTPALIVLDYSAEVMQVGAQILITDADGNEHPLGQPAFEGTRVSVEVPEDLDEGAYTVAWRVVSSDGHPISGVIPFTVGEATITQEPSAQAEATVPVTETAAGDVHSLPWLRPVLIGAGGAVAAGGLFALVVWRKKPHAAQ